MRWACLFLFAWAAIGADATNGPVRPVSVFVKEKRGGFDCDIVLAITNTHAFPVWYVMGSVNDLLREDDFGPLKVDDSPEALKNRFVGRTRMEISEQDDGHGRAVEVHFDAGWPGGGFWAMLLPPGADFRAEMLLGMWGRNWREGDDFLHIWEVEHLLVNGEVPLEKWLSKPVLSSRVVRLGHVNKVHSRATAITSVKEYADQKVEWVKAEPIDQHVVRLLGPILPEFNFPEGSFEIVKVSEGVYSVSAISYGSWPIPGGRPFPGTNAYWWSWPTSEK